MGIFDKAKDLLSEHNDKVDSGIDSAARLVNDRTGGQHADKITGASEQAKTKIDEFIGNAPPAAGDSPAEPTAAADSLDRPVAPPPESPSEPEPAPPVPSDPRRAQS